MRDTIGFLGRCFAALLLLAMVLAVPVGGLLIALLILAVRPEGAITPSDGRM